MQYKDYYQTLGLSKQATQDEIKQAYRRLARKYHPDVSQEADAEARFKEINEANEVLRDPEKRAAYDQLGSQWHGGDNFTPPPGWDSGFEFSGNGRDRAFSDFFESIFGGRSPFGRSSGFAGREHHARAGKGEDRHAKIRIALEDAYHGSERTVTLQTPRMDRQGHVALEPHKLKVRIPKGITAGQKIRLAGQGEQAPGGGSPGDLYLQMEFEPHPHFTPEGRDLHVTVPITPWEAALGARVEVPTLGGKVELTIPPGSNTGQRLRLANRGLPGKPSGHQYVTLHIMTPAAQTEAQKKLYREMADAFAFNPREPERR